MARPLDLNEPAVHRIFGRDLAAFGDRTAIVTADGDISYCELAVRVRQAARRLGAGRRLVLVVGSNSVEAVVAYLGALAARHPVLLASDDHEVIQSLRLSE